MKKISSELWSTILIVGAAFLGIMGAEAAAVSTAELPFFIRAPKLAEVTEDSFETLVFLPESVKGDVYSANQKVGFSNDGLRRYGPFVEISYFRDRQNRSSLGFSLEFNPIDSNDILDNFGQTTTIVVPGSPSTLIADGFTYEKDIHLTENNPYEEIRASLDKDTNTLHLSRTVQATSESATSTWAIKLSPDRKTIQEITVSASFRGGVTGVGFGPKKNRFGASYRFEPTLLMSDVKLIQHKFEQTTDFLKGKN